MQDPAPSQLPDIEPADEAGEAQVTQKSRSRRSSKHKSSSMEQIPHQPELQVFKHNLGGEEPIPGAPLPDPLRRKSMTDSGADDRKSDWQQFPKDFNKWGIIKWTAEYIFNSFTKMVVFDLIYTYNLVSNTRMILFYVNLCCYKSTIYLYLNFT